jgi:predicted DNA-binding ribbon-helix-helix protein
MREIMTTTQVEIRTDVYTALQEIAETKQTSVGDLIADMTEQLKCLSYVPNPSGF